MGPTHDAPRTEAEIVSIDEPVELDENDTDELEAARARHPASVARRPPD